MATITITTIRPAPPPIPAMLDGIGSPPSPPPEPPALEGDDPRASITFRSLRPLDRFHFIEETYASRDREV